MILDDSTYAEILIDNILSYEVMKEMDNNEKEFSIKVGCFDEIDDETKNNISGELWEAYRKWNNDCYAYLQKDSSNTIAGFNPKFVLECDDDTTEETEDQKLAGEDLANITAIKDSEALLTEDEFEEKLLNYDGGENSTEGFYKLMTVSEIEESMDEAYVTLMHELINDAFTIQTCNLLNNATSSSNTLILSSE